ncbi:MAG TPA: alpha/beta hydrolase [Euzebyales bacterium]
MRVLKRALTWWAGSTLAAVAAALWAAGRARPVPPEDASPDPPPGLPPARVVAVDGRGEQFLRDAPGPRPDAPTVLLLHGWMFPADMHWFTSYDAVAEHARVVAPDHRGHGRGPRPSRPFRLVDAADDVAAVLGALDTGPVTAVGYSMGGPIALLLWQRHPDLVSGLVLCATSATFNVTRVDQWLWRGMGLLQLVMRLLPRHWWERGLRAVVDERLPLQLTRMIGDELPRRLQPLLPWMIGEVDRGSAEDIAEAGRELSRFDARGWVPTVDVPRAVVITARDTLVPVANQRDLATRLGPDTTVVEIDVDHDAMIARDDVFVPALMRALAATGGIDAQV